MLWEILAGLSTDNHRIACLRGVSVNFKFSSILSQTAKWTFSVLVIFLKIWLVNKTELRMKEQFGKSTRTALFRILGSIVVRFFDNKLMFVFILCLYSQTMELFADLKQFYYTVQPWNKTFNSIANILIWYLSFFRRKKKQKQNTTRSNWPMIKDILKRKIFYKYMTIYDDI